MCLCVGVAMRARLEVARTEDNYAWGFGCEGQEMLNLYVSRFTMVAVSTEI